LRKFNLALAFDRRRALREDIEDQDRAIDDLSGDRLFQVAQLRGRELFVENDRIGLRELYLFDDLGHLALPDEGRRVGSRTSLHEATDHLAARRVHERCELVEACVGVIAVRTVQLHADNHNALALRLVARQCRDVALLRHGLSIA
jgi:hypothetical protein